MGGMTPEERAVIDAAVAWITKNVASGMNKELGLRLDLRAAVTALIAAQPEYGEKESDDD